MMLSDYGYVYLETVIRMSRTSRDRVNDRLGEEATCSSVYLHRASSSPLVLMSSASKCKNSGLMATKGC